MSLVQLFCLPPNICLVLFINGNSLKCFYFLCYFIIQVQSYIRRKVALEIRNKKGKLSNLGFLEQERTRKLI